MAKRKLYTYIDFANDALALADGNVGADFDSEAFRNKAKDLKLTNEKKAEYAKTHKKASTPKGPSEDTLTLMNRIFQVLDAEPKTAKEINEILGENFSPLKISTALKYHEDVSKTTVIREVVCSKGLKAEKSYTAYLIDPSNPTI